MNRLEELLLKWQDQNLSQRELAELNVALKDPIARRELMTSFAFDAQLREALHSAKALAQTAASAEEFQTQEVREAHVLEDREGVLENFARWIASVGQRARANARNRWMTTLASGAAVTIITIAAVMFGSAKTIAIIEGNGSGVTVQRGSAIRPAKQGMALQPGDRIKTSGDYSVWVRYLNEPTPTTQIKLSPGTQLKIDQDATGKRLELLVGSINAKVAPQPQGHPMRISTPQSDAKILGTEFVLIVEASSTRLEVIEGSVQLCNREDGKAVAVNRDQFATVAKGVELAARSLLPAPWNSQDIGSVGMTGYARIEGHRCKLKGAGKPDAKSKDQFHFLYQTLEGDGEIRARLVDVELTHSLAKAGVLIRDNLKPNSPHAFLYLRAGSGVEFAHRNPAENKTDWAGGDAAPYWLRLTRRGEWVYAYKSADGLVWSEVGSDRIKMHGKIYVGLAVNSWNNSKLTTSIFDNVNVIPGVSSNVEAVAKE